MELQKDLDFKRVFIPPKDLKKTISKYEKSGWDLEYEFLDDVPCGHCGMIELLFTKEKEEDEN